METEKLRSTDPLDEANFLMYLGNLTIMRACQLMRETAPTESAFIAYLSGVLNETVRTLIDKKRPNSRSEVGASTMHRNAIDNEGCEFHDESEKRQA